MSSSATQIRFDDLLEYRIKAGIYHVIVFFTSSFICFIDGADIISYSLVLPVITKQWNISAANQSLISFILFAGSFLGTFFCGALTTKFGRRRILLWALLSQFLLSLTATYIESILTFLIVRFLLAFTLGVMTTIAPLQISEIMPLEWRGQAVILSIFFTSFGKLYGCIISWFVLSDPLNQNWRQMILWSYAPTILGWIGVYFFTFESPRYVIVMGRVEEGIAILNKIGHMNDDDFVEFDERITEDMRRWQMTVYKKEEVESIFSLLRSEYKPITLSLSATLFSVSFIYFGTIFILPEILEILAGPSTDDKAVGTDLWGITIAVLGELPSAFAAFIMIEKKFFGRRKSLFWCAGASFLLLLLSSISTTSLLVLLIASVRFLMRIMLAILLLLSIELYPTHCRTTGVGVTASMGRLGTSLMPWFCIALLNLGAKIPLLGFSFACILALGAIYQLPYDTLRRYLDTKGDQSDNYVELPNMSNWEHIADD